MTIAILLAAGKSQRAGRNKLWVDLDGAPLWTHAYQTLLSHPEITQIILVVPKGEEFRFLPLVDARKTQIVSGGETRMESFSRGLALIETLTESDIIIDHNAANPFVTAEEIAAVTMAAKRSGAAAVCHELVDTLVKVKEEKASKVLTAAADRSEHRLMQTPQAVRGDVLASASLGEHTDLSTALFGHATVELIPAHPNNKKITLPQDIERLQMHACIGEDSHRFGSGGQLILGGLVLEDHPALEANSDGDVILHAIGRALAQACGENFSEQADPLLLSGITNSQDYLEPFLGRVKIYAVSLSIEGSRPRIDPISAALKENLAKQLGIAASQIRISAHTGEDLSPFGQGEGLRCLAALTFSPL